MPLPLQHIPYHCYHQRVCPRMNSMCNHAQGPAEAWFRCDDTATPTDSLPHSCRCKEGGHVQVRRLARAHCEMQWRGSTCSFCAMLLLAANGLRLRVVGAVKHIPILAVAADAVGRADALCMHFGPPVRLSTAAVESLRRRQERSIEAGSYTKKGSGSWRSEHLYADARCPLSDSA